LFGTMRTSVSPCISARNEQPTPQYAQVVMALLVAWPCASSAFSINAPVGHACTQAPHETHSESRNGSSWLATIFDAKARPCTVSANVPCTSSHARTQREQLARNVNAAEEDGRLTTLRGRPA